MKCWGCSLISKGVLLFSMNMIVDIIKPMSTKAVSNRTGSLVKVIVYPYIISFLFNKYPKQQIKTVNLFTFNGNKLPNF